MYKVCDCCDGNDKYFYSLQDAKTYKREQRKKLHNKYCIEKQGPEGDCLCIMTNNQQECAAHYDLRTLTVTDHI
ncbi:hypothetical protein LCGC14_3038490, partial [marine sediment metagenome]